MLSHPPLSAFKVHSKLAVAFFPQYIAMSNALEVYSAALVPHEHLGHGLSLIVPLALLFAVGYFIGKLMHKKRDLKHYQERLDALVQSIDAHRRKVSRGVIWELRLESGLRLYAAITGVAVAAVVYLGHMEELVHCYEYPLGAVFAGLVLYLAKRAFVFRTAIHLDTLRSLEQDLADSKKNLRKELGPDIIAELTATDKCSKLCEERKKSLEQDLERHKWLVMELSKFAWCDGCSRESKCTGDCGGRYWRFTKETLRKFHTSGSKAA